MLNTIKGSVRVNNPDQFFIWKRSKHKEKLEEMHLRTLRHKIEQLREKIIKFVHIR